MKKFRFRYESVLKMRLDKEENLKNDLAKQVQKRQVILDRIDKLNASLDQYSIWIQDGLREGRKMAYHEIDQGKKYYKKHIKEQMQLLKSVEVEIERIKALLIEAMKERKVMEKVKEKDFQTYIEEFNKADAKVIEEIVNYKNNKKEGDE